METAIEQYIRRFVHSKTEEKVELHLTPDLHIRHAKKKGSILLAAFWANLLQHPNNFPKRKYSYKKMIDRSTAKDKLVVKVLEANVTLSVFMESGTLVIQGKDIYAWFKDNFITILDNYDDKFKDQFIYEPKPNKQKGSGNLELHPDGKTECNLTETTGHRSRDQDKCQISPSHNKSYVSTAEIDRKVEGYMEEHIPGLENLSIDCQEYLTEDELDENLSNLRLGGLHDGYSCVYRTWKSLLNKWFKTNSTDIYIVTPSIDEHRLQDIVDCFIEGQYKGTLQAFYVSCYCDGSTSISEMKKSVAKKFQDTRLQVIIEHFIYRNIMYPMNKEFEGKFIAAVNNGMAEVLITSAGFNGQNFRHKSLHTAQYLTMPENTFKEKYLSVVESPVVHTML